MSRERIHIRRPEDYWDWTEEQQRAWVAQLFAEVKARADGEGEGDGDGAKGGEE